MTPTVTIRETGPAGSYLEADDVRDMAHVRRLLAQALTAGTPDEAPGQRTEIEWAKVQMLLGFLEAQGAQTQKAKRLLLVAGLLALEDEDEARRKVAPSPLLPVLVKV